MGWYEDLIGGLTGTALRTAENIGGPVGDSIGQYTGSDVGQDGAPATALATVNPYGPVVTSGWSGVFEIVGPERAPYSTKQAVLFGSWPMGAVAGTALFLVLILAILAMLWFLLKPEKRKRRRRKRVSYG